MNHPEPFRTAGPLRWRWWTQSIAERTNATLRYASAMARLATQEQNQV